MSVTDSDPLLGIPDFLDRKKWVNGMPPRSNKFVGTFTILSTYRNCPHQMFRCYIAKDLGPFVETPEIKWGNDVHKAFELRLKARKPLPVKMQRWESFCTPFDKHEVHTELQMGVTKDGRSCDFWADDVWFRGKADVVLVQKDAAYVSDWKTGNPKYEDSLELRVLAVLLHAKFPHLKRICGSYIWLRDDRVGTLHDLSDTRATWFEMQTLMRDIEAKRPENAFEATRNGLCSWCPVKDCEHWRETPPRQEAYWWERL